MALQSEHTSHFTVHFPPPLDIPASLDIFRRSGDDGIDRWDGQVLLRTLRVADRVVPFAATVVGSIAAPAMQVSVAQDAPRLAVEHAVRTMFVTAPEDLTALCAHDPVIAHLHTRYPGLRPVLQTDAFTALIRAISAQQVNLQWATTTRRRLAETFGCLHTLGARQVWSLSSTRLAQAEVAALRALQFTTRKAEYMIGLAQAVATQQLDLAVLHEQPDADVIARLTACRGLGQWTAEWFLARALGRPRVVAGDLGVRKAIGAAYNHGVLPSAHEVQTLTAHWGAAAGVAQQLVLHGLSQGFG
ncbi:MAG: DNA-3-methyladenine glycosylase 2 family protein [Candidatus Tectomicrobia bacterium]|uniref:DNA-3-methyladenine glycosylase II n=1 Tax=Tectimicrobiota bacterium TaxID=2528274 RepID=A0A938B2A5_UNCTE|nr:DNA-3-methyladenine glycosylase 2 family protein [Candidatus Tectomicrobia bacterium]